MKTIRALAVIAAVCAGLFAGPARAYQLSFNAPAKVGVGDVFTVGIELDDTASLTSFDIGLRYEPTALMLNDVSRGKLIAGNNWFTSDPPDGTFEYFFWFDNSGQVLVNSASLGGLPNVSVAGERELLSLTFEALLESETTLDFATAPDPLSELGFNLDDPNSSAQVAGVSARIGITSQAPIPEPSTLALLGASIVGVLGLRAGARRV